jgi:hypothetical protein
MDASTRELHDYLSDVRYFENLIFTCDKISQDGANSIAEVNAVIQEANAALPVAKEEASTSGCAFWMFIVLLFIPLTVFTIAMALKLLGIIDGEILGDDELSIGHLLFLCVLDFIVFVWIYVGYEPWQRRKIRREIEPQIKQSCAEMEKSISDVALAMSKVAQHKPAVQRMLAAFYDLNIIYPKYRNLVAVSTFCEYLESGRRTAADWPGRIYDLYEEELRANTIINRLDVIVSQLDRIRGTQYLLYESIQESNRLSAKVIDEAGKEKKFTALMAMFSRCAAVKAQSLAELKNGKYSRLRRGRY